MSEKELKLKIVELENENAALRAQLKREQAPHFPRDVPRQRLFGAGETCDPAVYGVGQTPQHNYFFDLHDKAVRFGGVTP